MSSSSLTFPPSVLERELLLLLLVLQALSLCSDAGRDMDRMLTGKAWSLKPSFSFFTWFSTRPALPSLISPKESPSAEEEARGISGSQMMASTAGERGALW